MKWVIIKGVRYPSSVISAFAAYNIDKHFLKIRIRNKWHIVSFDDINKMDSQMVYLMNNYPDFVQIGRWWISKKAVMSWVPKGQAVDGSGWVISFTLSFGFDNGAANQNNIERYRFATKDERQEFIDALKTSEEPKAKIYLKQFFGIKIEPKYKFKPFDKVLVRDTEEDDWHVSLFVREIADAQYKEERYECLNGTGWIYCIPYEGNEHLL